MPERLNEAGETWDDDYSESASPVEVCGGTLIENPQKYGDYSADFLCDKCGRPCHDESGAKLGDRCVFPPAPECLGCGTPMPDGWCPKCTAPAAPEQKPPLECPRHGVQLFPDREGYCKQQVSPLNHRPPIKYCGLKCTPAAPTPAAQPASPPERVKLVPLKSTWSCPKCNHQNIYTEGIVSSPQNTCAVCGTEVILGAIRASRSSGEQARLAASKAELTVTQWENRRSVDIWHKDRKVLVTLIENALIEALQGVAAPQGTVKEME